MTQQNILITSAGKRVALTKIFIEAMQRNRIDGNVFTTELNPSLSPAAQISDRCFQVPRVTDSEYINILYRICRDNSIALVIPTIDTELAVLSENKAMFEAIGTAIAVSDLSFIKSCRDKRQTMSLFDGLNIPYPGIRDKHSPIFPMFAKPYDGSLSTNLHIIRKQEDLTQDILNDEKLIFMEYIDKSVFKEYTVDMYYGRDNHVKSIVPRERIEVRAGEINKGITRKNWLVEYLRERMEYIHGVIGCICLQLFANDETKQVYAIEINPRFGGGYPLTYHSGANYPEWLIEEYILGNDHTYRDDWNRNTLMLRYDAEIIINDFKN